MATSDRLPPGSDSSDRLNRLTSGDDSDAHLVRVFRRRVKVQPDQPVWVAYRYRTTRNGDRLVRPQRAYRLMVHLPGHGELTGFERKFPGTPLGWAAWRFAVALCGVHPVLRQARWP